MTHWFATLSILLASSIASCAKTTTPRTQVIIELDADPRVRASMESLQIRVEGASGRPGGEYVPRFEEKRTIGEAFQWPTRIALSPLDGDPVRLYRFTATALAENETFVAEVKVLSGYVPAQTLVLRRRFEDSCVGVRCGENLSCRDANCVSARVDVSTLPRFNQDAGLEGRADAGETLDAQSGSSDAIVDASRPDARVTLDAESGSDAIVDAAGLDAIGPDAPSSGCAVEFDGTPGQMISTLNMPPITTPGTYVYEMWVKPTSLPSGANSVSIMTIGATVTPMGPEGYVQISYTQDGVWCEFGTSFGGGNIVGGVSLPVGSWSHIACEIVYSSATRASVRLWTNGSSAASGAGMTATPIAPLRFNSAWTGPSSFAGSYDEIRVSRANVYPPSEITPERRLPSLASTVALWHFDDCATPSQSEVGPALARLEVGARMLPGGP